MLRYSMAAAALAVTLAGCGPTADPDDYLYDLVYISERGFVVAEIHCRGEVGRSRAWLPTDRQAIFDQCMQTKGFVTRPVWAPEAKE